MTNQEKWLLMFGEECLDQLEKDNDIEVVEATHIVYLPVVCKEHNGKDKECLVCFDQKLKRRVRRVVHEA